MLPAAEASPRHGGAVFVHSSFRTGSTWLWSMFRNNPVALAYNEIFNDALATLTPERALGYTHASWPSKHPPVGSYHAEYIPLLRPRGGVRRYRPSMAFDSFVPSQEGQLTTRETAYVALLLDHAQAAGRVPVLTATRSLARAPALRARFGGVHIVLYRNIFRQWASYTEQAVLRNRYFLDTIAAAVGAAAHDPALGALAPLLKGGLDVRQPATWQAMLLLHAHLYARAADAADLVLDIDRIAADPACRAQAEADLLRLTGLAVDLSTVRATMAFSLVDAGSVAELTASMAGLPAPETSAGTNRGRVLGRQALAEAIGAYGSYRAEHGPLVDALQGEFRAMEQKTLRENAAIASRLLELEQQKQREVDALATELAAIRRDKQREIDALAAELEALRQKRRRDVAAIAMELEALRHSRSWRLTAPVRRLAETIRGRSH
jgi:hypothetical protein